MGRPIRRVLFQESLPFDGHLSQDYVAAALQRSTRHLGEPRHRCLSDLAPGEVCPASPITRAPGGLLHHRFTLTAGRGRRRSALCCTVLAHLCGWVLPTALLCGARTFLGGGVPLAGHPSDATVWPAHLRKTGYRAEPRYGPSVDRARQRPDSPVRTRIAFESGHSSTASGAAVRTASRSLPVSSTPLALETRARRCEAPTP